ncbi:MAG: aminodeoxychorismate/anthranilate synthase component II [Alphaproteobacteria bacterium]|nr:aminodeoxychorismate/anthranilate synthase component II [Alphaproteobacteria bacterium]
MILLIDNYDSFVYNLARYVGILGWERQVVRNDAITLAQIEDMRPAAIILSPGPGRPKDAGICMDVVRRFGPEIPILGVCLGHQCIGEAYGGRTVPAKRLMHGKTSLLDHPGRGIFIGLPNPLRVARYHSLVTELPANSNLLVTAVGEDGEVMAMRHGQFPVHGIQFHPESVLTDYGLDIIRNFVTLTIQWSEGRRHRVRAA